MNEIDLLGLDNDSLEIHQVLVRCIIAFITSFIGVFVAGIRIFGRTSALDNVMVLMIGAILGRSIVVPKPFFESLVAVMFLVVMHRVVAYVSFSSKKTGLLFKGDKQLLYAKGNFLVENMKRVRVTQNDIMAALRLTLKHDGLETVREIYLERSGDISFVCEQS